MPSHRFVVSVGVLSLHLVACPAILSDPFRVGSSDGSAPGADAAAADAPALSDVADSALLDANDAGDAGDSGGTAACCTVVESDPLGPATIDAWLPRGTARPFTGFVELNPDQPNQAGGLFWPTTDRLSDFELEFDFSITKQRDDAGSVPADGLAFVALSELPTGCSTGGSDLCVLGSSSGFAVVVRTYPGPTDPAPTPYLALVNASRSFGGDAGPLVQDGGFAHPDASLVSVVTTSDAAPPAASWRTLCLRVNAGKATVKLDGQRLWSNVDLPSGLSQQALSWGFTGATGSFSERNAVRNVRWRSASLCNAGALCADAGICGD